MNAGELTIFTSSKGEPLGARKSSHDVWNIRLEDFELEFEMAGALQTKCCCIYGEARYIEVGGNQTAFMPIRPSGI